MLGGVQHWRRAGTYDDPLAGSRLLSPLLLSSRSKAGMQRC